MRCRSSFDTLLLETTRDKTELVLGEYSCVLLVDLNGRLNRYKRVISFTLKEKEIKHASPFLLHRVS